MHLAATRRPGSAAGFLHVPYLPGQAARHPGAPSMALDDIVRGIEIILAVAAARTRRHRGHRGRDQLMERWTAA